MVQAFFALLGGALVSGCSLGGLVFDIPGSGGANAGGGTAVSGSGGAGSGSAITGSGGASASGGSGGGGAGGASASGGSGGGGEAPCISGSTSSTGTGATESDCTNGLDDDGNGYADCYDPNCTGAGFQCTDVPEGWSGPSAFYEGSPTTIPCCPLDYPSLGPRGGASVAAQAAACSACGCSPASVLCEPAYVDVYAAPDCTNPTAPVNQDGACRTVGGASFGAQAPSVKLDGCVASGGDVISKPAPAWSVADQICNAPSTSKGCGSGQVCARPVGFMASNTLCFWRSGQVDCPAGLTKKYSFYTSIHDDRGCSPCACPALPPASCSVTTTLYASSNCALTKKVGQLPNNGSCVNQSGVLAFKTAVVPNAPSCPPTGGAPTGAVVADADAAITVCCTN
jgi:hypothetical protein